MFRAPHSYVLGGMPWLLGSVPLQDQLKPHCPSAFKARCYATFWNAIHAGTMPTAPIAFVFEGITYHIHVPALEQLRTMEFFNGMAAHEEPLNMSCPPTKSSITDAYVPRCKTFF